MLLVNMDTPHHNQLEAGLARSPADDKVMLSGDAQFTRNTETQPIRRARTRWFVLCLILAIACGFSLFAAVIVYYPTCSFHSRKGVSLGAADSMAKIIHDQPLVKEASVTTKKLERRQADTPTGSSDGTTDPTPPVSNTTTDVPTSTTEVPETTTTESTSEEPITSTSSSSRPPATTTSETSEETSSTTSTVEETSSASSTSTSEETSSSFPSSTIPESTIPESTSTSSTSSTSLPGAVSASSESSIPVTTTSEPTGEKKASSSTETWNPSGGTTTVTSVSEVSGSSAVVKTKTSELPGGGHTTITSTSWVDADAQPTEDAANPELQDDAGSSLSRSSVFSLAIALTVTYFLAA